MSLIFAARTDYFRLDSLLFLRERCWSKRIRERSRPLLKLTRELLSRALLQERSLTKVAVDSETDTVLLRLASIILTAAMFLIVCY